MSVPRANGPYCTAARAKTELSSGLASDAERKRPSALDATDGDGTHAEHRVHRHRPAGRARAYRNVVTADDEGWLAEFASQNNSRADNSTTATVHASGLFLAPN